MGIPGKTHPRDLGNLTFTWEEAKISKKKKKCFFVSHPLTNTHQNPLPLEKKKHHVALPYRSSLEELFLWSNCGNEMSPQHLGRKKHIIFLKGQPFSIFLGGVSEFLWGKNNNRYQAIPAVTIWFPKSWIGHFTCDFGSPNRPKKVTNKCQVFFFRFFVIIFMSHYRNLM